MDTVRERELARLRAMTPAEKLKVAEALWRDAWALTEAGIVVRHPGWTREQLRQETRRLMSGGRAWPPDEYHAPPEDAFVVESARHTHGYFNIVHIDTGLVADVVPPVTFVPASSTDRSASRFRLAEAAARSFARVPPTRRPRI